MSGKVMPKVRYDDLKNAGGVEIVNKEALSKTVEAILGDSDLNRKFHIDAFTSAYYSLTKTPPTDAVLCEIKLRDTTIYFFDTKDNLFEKITEQLSLSAEEELNDE